jgi:hypothetical protein
MPVANIPLVEGSGAFEKMKSSFEEDYFWSD